MATTTRIKKTDEQKLAELKAKIEEIENKSAERVPMKDEYEQLKARMKELRKDYKRKFGESVEPRAKKKAKASV